VLRVRTLHASVLRRAEAAQAAGRAVPQTSGTDPIEEATVILAGRGRTYPDLSVGIGEHTSVIGVLTIEAAARFLKTRDADGLVIGDGFHPQSVEAILTVVAEDSRFRDLPIGVIGHQLSIDERELPHLVFADDPDSLIVKILPLVRLHAFERRLRRTLENFDQDGVVDQANGLLCQPAFIAELDRVIRDADQRSDGLSLARFTFDDSFDDRALNDAARMIGKLMRSADFACRDDDGTILVAFAETDLRRAQAVTKRLTNVLKHTMLLPDQPRATPTPRVTLTRRKPADTVASLLSRVTIPAVAAE
jgi:GGDEF domain-containing protein